MNPTNRRSHPFFAVLGVRLHATLFLLSIVVATTAWGQPIRLLPFQARLADTNGKAIPDGATVVQFQIFTEPTGGSLIWAGEVHRATINGGLINVTLGAKNRFPMNRTNDAGAVLAFFDATVYLEATVDSSGKPDGTPDGRITAADPPLLPRQAILPVIFAAESGDARKLAGYDWTPLFGVNSPTGTLPGNKITPGTVSAEILATASVQTQHLVDGAISAAKLNASLMARILDLEQKLASVQSQLDKQAARISGMRLVSVDAKTGNSFACGGESVAGNGSDLWVMYGSRDGTSCGVYNLNYFKRLELLIPFIP